MQISLAAIADAANVTQAGKLNILGQFNSIAARTFPCQHPAMTLVIQVLAEAEDSLKEFTLDVSLIDQDAQRLWGAVGTFRIPEIRPGEFGHNNQLIELRGVSFHAPGRYRFRLVLSGAEEPTDVVFQVTQAEVPK